MIRHAAALVDKHDNLDYTSLSTLITIIEKCHTLIYDSIVEQKYKLHFDKMEKQRHYAAGLVINLFRQILFIQEKYLRCSEGGPVKGEEKIKVADRYLLRLARSEGAILITADEKLIDILSPNDEGFARDFGIEVYTPKVILRKLNSE